jgi:hypothetical protein
VTVTVALLGALVPPAPVHVRVYIVVVVGETTVEPLVVTPPLQITTPETV